MPPLASAQRIAWEQSQRVWLVRQAIVAICLLVSVPLFVRYGEGLISGFGAMAGLLLGGALLLPPVLGVVLRWAAGRSKRPLTEWFWADSRQQLSGLSMALMALLLALSANIGVGTMVDGFRETFPRAWRSAIPRSASLDSRSVSSASQTLKPIALGP